jgi:hypothetical protein
MSTPQPPGPAPTPSATPAPTRRIVTVRRTGAIKLGLALVIGGIALIAVGSVIAVGQQAVQLAAASGRARVGNPIRFDAEEARYVVTFVADPIARDFAEDRIQYMDCTVRHADGTEDLDPASASMRLASSAGVFIDDFRGRGGPTEVTCEWQRNHDVAGSYVVAKSRKSVEIIGTVALVAGILVLIGGISALIVGYRGKQEIQSIT